MIRSTKILRHARGQPCQLAIPGICSHDPETTVFAHLNGGAFGKGMGVKAHDFAGFFADYNCHTAYDQHKTGLTDADLNAALLKAVIGTWEILIRDGVIIVPVDVEAPATVKPRKRKSERKPIPKPSNPWPVGRKLQSRKFGK